MIVICGRPSTLAAPLAALFGLGLATQPAHADPVADFYHGKTITLIVGTSPGNDYDYRGRIIARHIGRHIPGEPLVVPQNMPGAGGIKAANYLASIAPKDGTVVHMIMTNMMATQALGIPGVEFDTRQFRWIGNTTSTPNVINSWHTSGITKIDEVKSKELIVGAPKGTAGVVYPTLLNKLAGTKFKIVTGYAGGNEVNIAMERGEVQGRGSNSWASWKSTRPQWLAEKKIHILVQVGLQRDPELADVPLLLELVSEERDRKLMTFISAETAISRALVTAPGVPAERVTALRRAFDATMKDPQFLAEADKAKMDIGPMTGEEAQKIADSIANTPGDVVAYAKEVLGDLLR
jgi:tripartite-type tricarboxylate transporter receptor subunit TctC